MRSYLLTLHHPQHCLNTSPKVTTLFLSQSLCFTKGLTPTKSKCIPSWCSEHNGKLVIVYDELAQHKGEITSLTLCRHEDENLWYGARNIRLINYLTEAEILIIYHFFSFSTGIISRFVAVLLVITRKLMFFWQLYEKLSNLEMFLGTCDEFVCLFFYTNFCLDNWTVIQKVNR